MKTVQERLKFLQGIDLFSQLAHGELGSLAEAAQEVVLAAGEQLFDYGSFESSVFVIISGEIGIFRNSKTISSLGAGEYFGELALLETAVRSAAARANRPSILLELPAELCQQLFDANPRMHASITRTLGERLRATNDSIVTQFEKVNMLVHDMRNLLCMMEYAQIVADSLPAESENRGLLDNVMEGRDRLEAMMLEALDMARGGVSELPVASVDLGKALRECAECELAQHSDVKQVVVLVQVPSTLRPVACNDASLKRVIANLVINAAQASAPGAEVVVEVSQTESLTSILVIDQGAGIPEECKRYIFEPHFTSKAKGNGLGLSACKGIIEDRHGGSLTFVTELGEGTTFRCELPG